MSSLPHNERRTGPDVLRPNLSLVPTPSTPAAATRGGREKERHELELTFGELTLIYKSLQAVKTLGSLPPEDELLNDTMQLVDQALNKAA
jgi:hypothetical protein